MGRQAKRQKTATPQIQQGTLPNERLADQVSTLIGSVNSLVTLVSKLVDSPPNLPPTTASQNSNSNKDGAQSVKIIWDAATSQSISITPLTMQLQVTVDSLLNKSFKPSTMIHENSAMKQAGITTVEIKRLLLRHRVQLVENILLDDDMWNHLRSAQVLNAARRDKIEHNKTHNQQIASLLDYLDRAPDDAVSHFLEALRLTNQNHIVTALLTPSSQNEVPSTRDMPGANEHRTMTEDNKKLLDDNRKNIIKNMNLNETMWTKLINAKIITDENARSIRKHYGMAEDQVAPFLDQLIRRPEDDFHMFCNILKECNQGLIVDKYLTKK